MKKDGQARPKTNSKGSKAYFYFDQIGDFVLSPVVMVLMALHPAVAEPYLENFFPR